MRACVFLLLRVCLQLCQSVTDVGELCSNLDFFLSAENQSCQRRKGVVMSVNLLVDSPLHKLQATGSCLRLFFNHALPYRVERGREGCGWMDCLQIYSDFSDFFRKKLVKIEAICKPGFFFSKSGPTIYNYPVRLVWQ